MVLAIRTPMKPNGVLPSVTGLSFAAKVESMIQQPLLAVEKDHAHLPGLIQQDLAVLIDPFVLRDNIRLLALILIFDDAFVPNYPSRLSLQKSTPPTSDVREPHGIVVTVRLGDRGMSHSSKTLSRRPNHRKQKRPLQPRPKVVRVISTPSR